MEMKLQISTTEKVRCPNCGSHAERRTLSDRQIMQTVCPSCDYLMVCSQAGNVVEAYAPGIAARC